MAKLNINTASMDQLLDVPGIGTANARQIADAREEAEFKLTLDMYKGLRVSKQYPTSVEAFEFFPDPQESSIPPTVSAQTVEKPNGTDLDGKSEASGGNSHADEKA